MADVWGAIDGVLDRLNIGFGRRSSEDSEVAELSVAARSMGVGLANDALVFDAVSDGMSGDGMASMLPNAPPVPAADRISESLLIACENSVVSDTYAINFQRLAKDHALGRQGVVLEFLDPSDGSRITDLERHWLNERDGLSLAGMDWWELERLAISSLVTGGCILIESRLSGGNYGVQLHSALDLHDDRSRDEHPFGVRLDGWGKPISYRLWSGPSSRREILGNGSIRTSPTRDVAARNMIHIFDRRAPHQYRGLPLLAPALFWLRTLADYEEAFMVGCQIAGYNPGFFTMSRDLMRNAYQPRHGAVDTPESDVADNKRAETVLRSIRQRVMSMSPRQRPVVPEGLSWVPITGENFNGSWYDSIKSQLIGTIAASMGVSFHTLAGDVSRANMASLTLAYSEDKVFYDGLQLFLGAFTRQVVHRWLAVSRGISPGEVTLNLRYNQMEPLNAIRSAQANSRMLEDGVKSKSEVIRERGADPERVMKEIRDDESISQPSD